MGQSSFGRDRRVSSSRVGVAQLYRDVDAVLKAPVSFASPDLIKQRLVLTGQIGLLCFHVNPQSFKVIRLINPGGAPYDPCASEGVVVSLRPALGSARDDFNAHILRASTVASVSACGQAGCI
jgi:hypothetical protein